MGNRTLRRKRGKWALFYLWFSWTASISAQLVEEGLTEGTNRLEPTSIAVCSFSGSIMIGGHMSTETEGQNIFVWKLRPSFKSEWFFQTGSEVDDGLTDLLCERSEYVIAVGWTDGDVPGIKLGEAGGRQGLIFRLDNGGKLQSGFQEGSRSNHTFCSVSLLPSGNAVVSGSAPAPIYPGPTGQGTFVLVTAPTLSNDPLPWSLAFGNSSSETAVTGRGNGEVVDVLGNNRTGARITTRLTRSVDGTGRFESIQDYLWSIPIEDPVKDVIGIGLERDSNGFPMVLQNRISPDGEKEVWMTKFDSTGAILIEERIRQQQQPVLAQGLQYKENDQVYVHYQAQSASGTDLSEFVTNSPSTLGTIEKTTIRSISTEAELASQPNFTGFTYDFSERNMMYFYGTPIEAEDSDFSLFRMPYEGIETEPDNQKIAVLSVQVAIRKLDQAVNITNEPDRLRDIIANDFPMDLGRIDEVNAVSEDGTFVQANLRMSRPCATLEQSKDTLREILDSTETRNRLEAAISRLGEIVDDSATGRCEDTTPTEPPAGGGGSGGVGGPPVQEPTGSSANMVPIIAGSIGGVIFFLAGALLFIVLYRPRKTTVYDLYANMDEEVAEPEPVLTAKEGAAIVAEPRAVMSRDVSFGGQGDII